jgi:hypothetical protein
MITFLITFVLVILAITALSIGWLITGKPKIVRGSCGLDPQRRRNDHCGKDIRCDLCEKSTEKKEDE